MTPDEIQAAARRKYNAVSDTFYTDSFFYDLIYEAETELAEEAQTIQKVYSASSVASQREYSWPTNAIAIKRLEYDGNKLRLATFRQDDAQTLSDASTTETGTPDFYQLWDRTIYLRPIPDTSSLTIKIYSYDMPSLQSTGNANLDTPVHYHKDIVNFCVGYLAAKNQDMNTAQMYQGLWQRAVERAKKWQRKRMMADQFKRVQNVDDLPATSLGLT